MGDVFPETHRLIAVLPVAFLASTVVFLPSVLLIFRIMQYASPGLVGILMLSEVLAAALSSWLLLQEALTLSQWSGMPAILGTGVIVGLTEKAAEPLSARALFKRRLNCRDAGIKTIKIKQ